jgi:hypothetical protein
MSSHRRIFPKSAAFVWLGLVFLHAGAAEVNVSQCPRTLTVQQYIESPVSGNWKTVSGITGNHPLAGIAISAGEYPTEQTGFDIPSGYEKLPNGGHITYYDHLVFQRKDTDYYKYWAVCLYHKTDAVVTKQIPSNVAYCEVRMFNTPTLYDEVPDRVHLLCFDETRPNAELK